MNSRTWLWLKARPPLEDWCCITVRFPLGEHVLQQELYQPARWNSISPSVAGQLSCTSPAFSWDQPDSNSYALEPSCSSATDMNPKGKVHFITVVCLSRIQSLGVFGFLSPIQKKYLACVCATELLKSRFLERSIASLLG